MNKIIPHRSPFVTYEVWCPKNAPSRTISRHHWTIVNKIIVTPKIAHLLPCPWNHEAVPTVKAKAPIDPVNGHGLSSTR